MNTLRCIVSSLAVAGFLTACGGGSDDIKPAGSTTTTTTTTTVTAGDASRYAGTWVGCFSEGPTTSSRQTLVLTQQGANSLSGASTETAFAAPSCGGTAGVTKTSSGTIAFAGTKTIGADTVDKATITFPGKPPQKQVLLVKGTAPAMLFFGKEPGDGGTLDADGYPTTLESNGLTKQ